MRRWEPNRRIRRSESSSEPDSMSRLQMGSSGSCTWAALCVQGGCEDQRYQCKQRTTTQRRCCHFQQDHIGPAPWNKRRQIFCDQNGGRNGNLIKKQNSCLDNLETKSKTNYNSGSHWTVLELRLFDNRIKKKSQRRRKTKQTNPKQETMNTTSPDQSWKRWNRSGSHGNLQTPALTTSQQTLLRLLPTLYSFN